MMVWPNLAAHEPWAYLQRNKQSRENMKKRDSVSHKVYLQTLRRMSPEQRLNKAFELSYQSKQLFIQGLRERFPELGESEFKQLMLDRLKKCYNRNY